MSRPSVLLSNLLGWHNTYANQDFARDWLSIKLCRQELPLRKGIKSRLRPDIECAYRAQSLQLAVLFNNAGNEHKPRIRGKLSFRCCRLALLCHHGRRKQARRQHLKLSLPRILGLCSLPALLKRTASCRLCARYAHSMSGRSLLLMPLRNGSSWRHNLMENQSRAKS